MFPTVCMSCQIVGHWLGGIGRRMNSKLQMVYFRDGMTIDPDGDIGPKLFQHFCSTKIHGLSSKKSIEITPMGLNFF